MMAWPGTHQELVDAVLSARARFTSSFGDAPNRLRISTDLVGTFSGWLGGWLGRTNEERPTVVVANMVVVEDPALPGFTMVADRYSGSGATRQPRAFEAMAPISTLVRAARPRSFVAPGHVEVTDGCERLITLEDKDVT